MANYAVVDQVFGPDDAVTVAAAVETYLETIDSTTNEIVSLNFVPSGSGVTAILIHLG